jgi:hypothetical protein
MDFDLDAVILGRRKLFILIDGSLICLSRLSCRSLIKLGNIISTGFKVIDDTESMQKIFSSRYHLCLKLTSQKYNCKKKKEL